MQLYFVFNNESYIIALEESDSFDDLFDKIITRINIKYDSNATKDFLLDKYHITYQFNKQIYYITKKINIISIKMLKNDLVYEEIKDKYIGDYLSPEGAIYIKQKFHLQPQFDQIGLNVMKKLFVYLLDDLQSYDQIIISKFSYNVENNNFEKNIIQQFQHQFIRDKSKKVCIILYDQGFFDIVGIPCQFYDLIKVNDKEIDFIEDSEEQKRIKKFTKPKGTNFEKTKSHYSCSYIEKLKELTENKLIDKEIDWFVVKYVEHSREGNINFLIRELCQNKNLESNQIFDMYTFNGNKI